LKKKKGGDIVCPRLSPCLIQLQINTHRKTNYQPLPLSFLICVLPKRRMMGSYLRVLPATLTLILTLHRFSMTIFTLGTSTFFYPVGNKLTENKLSIQLWMRFIINDSHASVAAKYRRLERDMYLDHGSISSFSKQKIRNSSPTL
jgi:hypothetical protein